MLSGAGHSNFLQMGLVVLATASLAVLSMTFALVSGLHLPIALAVFGGLVWGAIIAIIDRFLITTMNLRGRLGSVFLVVSVRVVIAALLGLVISTPLVLQIFNREIQAQVVLSNAASSAEFGAALQTTPNATELQRVREQIATHEAALRGEIPAASSPELQSREDALAKARENLARLRSESEQKRRAWQCELYGSNCEGSTSDPGNGTLAKAREQEYLDAQAQTDGAQRSVNDAQQEVDSARNSATAIGAEALAKAQSEANAALPGLRERERALQDEFNRSLDGGSSAYRENNGLLAQLSALSALGDRDSEAKVAHWAVAGLFFMIELLPVLVKILTSLGAPSAYERVREFIENSKVDDAKADYRRVHRKEDEEEKRVLAEERKRSDIESDMREREKKLAIRANAHVEAQMQKVLEVALEKWSQDVQSTLTQRGANTTSSSAASASENGHRVHRNGHQSGGGASSVPSQSVKSRFNIPSSDNLGGPTGASNP